MGSHLTRDRVVAALVTVGLLACHSEDAPLLVDARYSEYLSVLSQQFESAARGNASATVQVVQVYAPGPKDGVSFRDVTRGRLLYESRASSEIASLFNSLQTRGARGNCELGEGPVLVIVAYDRDLPRVGVIRLYKCEAAGTAVIGVRPVGDAGLDYSSAADTYLRGIGVL